MKLATNKFIIGFYAILLIGGIYVLSYNNVYSAGINLVSNPSLETANGTSPASWAKGGWGTNTATLTYPVAGHTGTSSAQVAITSYTNGDAKWYPANMPVTSGAQYTYSDWYKSTIGSNIIMEYTLTSGTKQYVNLTSTLPATTTWAQTSTSFTVPIGVTSVTFFHLISAVGTLTIDDASLTANVSTPDTQAPVVSITSPSASSTVSGTININATASDNVGVSGIKFFIDGTQLNVEDTVAPYTTSWNTNLNTNAIHTMSAVARDASGNTSTSTISVTVNNTVVVTPPGDNLILNQSVETANATKANMPDKWQNGKWGTNTVTFNYPVTGIDGARGIEVAMTAYTSGDAKWFFNDVAVTSGKQYTYSEQYKGTVATEITARYTNASGVVSYVSLGTLPAATTWTTKTSTTTIPANIVSMTIFHLISKVGTLDTDNYKLSLVGATTTPPTDTVPPTVSIANPTNGTTASSTLSVKVNASDNVELSSIQLLVDSVLFSSTATTSPVTYNIDTTAYTNGVHTITAKAIDSSSNIASTSIQVTFANTVADTIAPVVSITSPSASSTATGMATILVSATDNVGVQDVHIIVDGENIGVDDTSPYSASFDTTTFKNGWHMATAYAEDSAGNIGNAAQLPFYIYNQVVNPADPNIINNASLEIVDPNNSSIPQGWQNGSWGTNNAKFTYPVNGIDGIKAARVDITNYTDGDAKWFFNDASTTEGDTYKFTDQYRSNATTTITAKFTYTDGSVEYRDIVTLPASTDWATAQTTIVVPSGTVKITLFHLLNSIGYLEVDNYYLSSTLFDPSNVPFDQGMVSLTFDDGWLSQYENALPILNAVNLKSSFYIISQETAEALPSNRLNDPNFEESSTSPLVPKFWDTNKVGNNDATFTYPSQGAIDGSVGVSISISNYTDGHAEWVPKNTTVISGQQYTYSGWYKSTIPTPIVANYIDNNNIATTVEIAVLAPSTTWKQFSKKFFVANNLKSMSIYNTLNGVGTLSLDDVDLERVILYMNPSQVIDLKNQGNEIGAHTQHHPDLITLSTTDATKEIAGSMNDLIGFGASPIDTFAYPYGSYNQNVVNIVKQAGYLGARGTDIGYNFRNSDKFTLVIQQIDKTTTLTQFQTWINSAKAHKSWLILMYHQVDDTGQEFGVSPALFQQMVETIVSQQIQTVTLDQGLAKMLP